MLAVWCIEVVSPVYFKIFACETNNSRKDQVNFFKGCLPQN